MHYVKGKKAPPKERVRDRGDDVQKYEELREQSQPMLFQRCGGGVRILRKKIGGV
jgi:hypothetical protein